jgi:hypothetical protein
MPGCVLQFSEIQAFAVPETSYSSRGQTVKAKIYLASYKKDVNPVISTTHEHIAKYENGVAALEFINTIPGSHTVTGTITGFLFNDTITRPWSFQYYVGSGKNSFNIDNMDICYLNVPHILTVDVPSLTSDITIDVQGAKVRKLSGNTFELTVTDKNRKHLYVYANEGVAGRILKVHPLPKPIPLLNGKRNTTISTKELGAPITTVSAHDDFECPATVTRYRIDIIKAGYKLSITKTSVSGNTLAPDVKAALSPGDKIYITDIVAKDKYGNSLALETISFSIIE